MEAYFESRGHIRGASVSKTFVCATLFSEDIDADDGSVASMTHRVIGKVPETVGLTDEP